MAGAPRKRITVKDWIVLGGVSVAFTIFYFSFILPYLQAVVLAPPLGSFQFSENEWFEATDVRITDPFTRSRFTVANDELFYNINYVNKKPYAITVEPDLHVIHGGELVNSKEDIEPVTLPANGNGQHRVRFFTDKEGVNQILFRVTVTNATDSTFLGSIETAWNIKVLSAEAFQQVEQNTIALWGVGISMIVAFASILYGLTNISTSRRQLRELQRQNELTSNQLRIQLRPWLGPDTTADPSHRPMTRIGFYHSGGTTVPDQVVESNDASTLNEIFDGWHLWIRNYGNIPASNVQTRVRYIRAPNRPDMEDVMREPPSVPSSLMMGEQMSVAIGVPAPWIKQESPKLNIRYDKNHV